MPWDDAGLAVQHRERARAVAREAARWEARRAEELQEAWDDAGLLRAKGLAMLAIPLSEARWTMKTAIDALRAAHELRAAVGLATVAAGLGDLSDEEIEAIAGAGQEDAAADAEDSGLDDAGSGIDAGA